MNLIIEAIMEEYQKIEGRECNCEWLLFILRKHLTKEEPVRGKPQKTRVTSDEDLAKLEKIEPNQKIELLPMVDIKRNEEWLSYDCVDYHNIRKNIQKIAKYLNSK